MRGLFTSLMFYFSPHCYPQYFHRFNDSAHLTRFLTTLPVGSTADTVWPSASRSQSPGKNGLCRCNTSLWKPVQQTADVHVAAESPPKLVVTNSFVAPYVWDLLVIWSLFRSEM